MKAMLSPWGKRAMLLAALSVLLPQTANLVHARSPGRLPSWTKIRSHVDRHFAQLADHRPGDILSQGDVAPLFAQLADMGWQVADEKEILADMLDDQHYLVAQLRSRRGKIFMRKVSSYQNIYDRLERISQVKGGKALIRDLIKLPDGQRYAKQKTRRGVPDLLDLLPKGQSGKTRKIKEYDQATDHIYTQNQFIQRLQKSYEQESRTSTSSR